MRRSSWPASWRSWAFPHQTCSSGLPAASSSLMPPIHPGSPPTPRASYTTQVSCPWCGLHRQGCRLHASLQRPSDPVLVDCAQGPRAWQASCAAATWASWTCWRSACAGSQVRVSHRTRRCSTPGSWTTRPPPRPATRPRGALGRSVAAQRGLGRKAPPALAACLLPRAWSMA